MEIKSLVLMVLLHVIDDFVLQPICLSNMKQKEWWKKQFCDQVIPDLYKNDYRIALLIHSISWSIMIMLPWMFIHNDLGDKILVCFLAVNTVIHYLIDDLKANRNKINLVEDQAIHFIQILVTWYSMCILHSHAF